MTRQSKQDKTPKPKPPVAPLDAMMRVKIALEEKFVAVKNSRRKRTDVVAFAKIEGVEFFLFKNGRWGCGARADHYRLEDPHRARTHYHGPGRKSRGDARQATDGLVALGVVTAADRDAIAGYFKEKERARTYASEVRELQWRAERLGVGLVFP